MRTVYVPFIFSKIFGVVFQKFRRAPKAAMFRMCHARNDIRVNNIDNSSYRCTGTPITTDNVVQCMQGYNIGWRIVATSNPN